MKDRQPEGAERAGNQKAKPKQKQKQWVLNNLNFFFLKKKKPPKKVSESLGESKMKDYIFGWTVGQDDTRGMASLEKLHRSQNTLAKVGPLIASQTASPKDEIYSAANLQACCEACKPDGIKIAPTLPNRIAGRALEQCFMEKNIDEYPKLILTDADIKLGSLDTSGQEQIGKLCIRMISDEKQAQRQQESSVMQHIFELLRGPSQRLTAMVTSFLTVVVE